MTWAYVQTMSTSWDDYQRVTDQLGEDVPDGLIVHVAGRHEGGVRIIDVWESQDAFARFGESRLMPAVAGALGEEAVRQGPGHFEPLEVEHMMRP